MQIMIRIFRRRNNEVDSSPRVGHRANLENKTGTGVTLKIT